MSEEMDNEAEDIGEPITAGPWSRRAAAGVRLRWIEYGTAQVREEVFPTMAAAEAYKRDLEAKGLQVVIG
jgi:hypothetical protein